MPDESEPIAFTFHGAPWESLSPETREALAHMIKAAAKMAKEKMPVYELWDLESGNAVGDFPTQAEALACVREMVAEYGRDEMLPWALELIEGSEVVAVAEGAALLDMALDADTFGLQAPVATIPDPTRSLLPDAFEAEG